jgi:hypothetical protein
VTDHQARRCPFGSHLAFAAQALGFGRGGLGIGHADVEDDVAGVAGASADAARDAAGPVRGRDAVNETVVGYGPGTSTGQDRTNAKDPGSYRYSNPSHYRIPVKRRSPAMCLYGIS